MLKAEFGTRKNACELGILGSLHVTGCETQNETQAENRHITLKHKFVVTI